MKPVHASAGSPAAGKKPLKLGIGLDEDIAIVTLGDDFEMLGASKIAIYDPGRMTSTNAVRISFCSWVIDLIYRPGKRKYPFPTILDF